MTYGYFILFEPVSQHFLLMMDFGMVSDSVFFGKKIEVGAQEKEIVNMFYQNKKHVVR